MYRYREQEKYDGKTVLIGGNSKVSLRSMKHLSKIGKPILIRGYVYKGRYDVNHTAVMVYGEEGTIRFGGFSWGYNGEGSRGLQVLFDKLGITRHKAVSIASWDGWETVGEKWRIEL